MLTNATKRGLDAFCGFVNERIGQLVVRTDEEDPRGQLVVRRSLEDTLAVLAEAA